MSYHKVKQELFTGSIHSRFDIVDVPFQVILSKAWQEGLENVVIIYDSACRFKVNAHARCVANPCSPLEEKFKSRLKPGSGFIKYFVNAFHQYSHNAECADHHSLRNSANTGMVTGEEIETSWAILNHLQYSIREMDSGARIDMITLHMLQINEDKNKKLGRQFRNF